MKRQKLLIALLSIAFCFSFIFGIKTAETPKADGIDFVTVEEMLENRDKILPAYKYTGTEQIAISDDGVISSHENGCLHYSEEVDAVAFDITLSDGNDLAFYLRTNADGTLWHATGYAAYVTPSALEIYKIVNPTAWNENKLGSASISSIFDGKAHTVELSLTENADGLTFTCSIDGVSASGVDTGTPISKENTEFKICRVNSPALYTISAIDTNKEDGGEEPEVDYTAGKTITDADMIANPNKLLPAINHAGAERLSVNDGIISPWSDGHFFYGDEVDDVTFSITISAGTNICFALRTSGLGTMWDATGYYAYVYKTETGAYVEIYKVTDIANWQTEETQLAKGDIANIFDGETHTVNYKFVPSENGSLISITVEGVEISGTDNGTPISKTNTNFKIAKVTDQTTAYTVGKAIVIEEGEYSVNYITAEDMMKNRDKLLPAFNHAGAERLAVENGVITSWENGYFYYNDEVEAIDIDFSMEMLTDTDVTFALRSAGDGVMWHNTGYFVYVNGTVAELYKVTNPSAWNSNQMAKATIANIFDGNYHNVKYYAVTDTKGYVHIGFTVDGVEAFTVADRADVLAIDGTEFKIASVNVSQSYTVTAPADTEHVYGEEQVTEPTCTEGGYTAKACENCGKKDIIAESAATGHTYTSEETAPTCLEAGYITYTCEKCGDSYTEDGAAATGHKYQEEKIEPTCTEKGYTKYTCVCGDSYMENFEDELGHEMAEATCTEPSKCSRCDYTEGEAKGHSFGEWEVTTEATETENGERQRECACGEIETEVIPATGSTSDDGNATDAGCMGSVSGLFGGLALLGLAVTAIKRKSR